MKKLTIQPFDFNDTVALDGRQLTRIYESRPLGIVFNSGNELTFTIDDFLEYVDRDFTLFELQRSPAEPIPTPTIPSVTPHRKTGAFRERVKPLGRVL